MSDAWLYPDFTNAKPGDLRVWWIPQIPGKPFHVPVPDVDSAVVLLDVLARYDMFQFKNRIKGDYSNAGGLEVFESDDGAPPEWMEWATDEYGDVDDYRNSKKESVAAQ